MCVNIPNFNVEMMNCMTLIAGRRITRNGRVLVAHNEDDSGHTAVRHAYVPARDWEEDATIPAESGRASIPQVKHTFGYYWIEYKQEKGGLITADSFANENGVVITSNSMMKSREDDEDASIVREGGIAYNLRRVLAERSKSARHGAEILMEMVETWGYGLSGRAYTLADKDEAFMFQLVRGHQYVGARVPDDAVVVMPNHYNFHTLHDCPEMFHSGDVIAHAVENGWYVPERDGEYDDFDFAAAYQHPDMWKNPINMLRQKNGQRLVLGRPWDPEAEGTPFAIYPDHPMDVKKFIEVMATHYEGTEDDCERFGPGRSPHDVPNTRRICTGTTLESDIYEFGDRPETLTIYTCLGRPCQTPYLPLHPLAGLPEAMREEVDPARMMAEHLRPEPGILTYRDSLRQRMRNLGCRHEMVYSDEIDELSGLLAEMLEEARQESAEVVAELSKLYADGERAQAAACACDRDGAFIETALQRMEAYANAHASDVQIAPLLPLDHAALPETLTLTLYTGLEPVEESMIFGVEFTDTYQNYAKAVKGSLQKMGARVWTARFPTAAFAPEAECAGKIAFWLGGQDRFGRAFAASTILTLH